MINVHAADQGRPVTVLAGCRHRRFAADFPGWGAPDHADYLIDMPAGLAGVVTAVESHGARPWTRYSVRFEDGTRASGLYLGTDFAFADGNPHQTATSVRYTT
jgi:hypothetical protein